MLATVRRLGPRAWPFTSAGLPGPGARLGARDIRAGRRRL